MTSEMTPKFSAEELHGCKNWLLPDVSSDKVLPSAEKEALDEKEKQKKHELKKGPINQSLGESIEVVEELLPSVTAEQLQEITDAAEKEGFDSGYKEGLEKGLKEGKEQGEQVGYEEGLAKSKETVAAQCEQLQHIIDALLIPLESEQKQLQDMILNMVSSLTKAVVLRELEQDSSHITQLVDDALNIIPVGADKFSLFLNSQDIEIVEKHLEYFQHSDEKHLTLHIDDTLLPGGCRLETQQTVVDYTVEQRLQKVIDGFLHKRFVDPNDNDNESEFENEKNNDDQTLHTSGEEGLKQNSETASDAAEVIEPKQEQSETSTDEVKPNNEENTTNDEEDDI